MMRRIAIGLWLTLAMAGCAKRVGAGGSTSEAAEFYPLAVGNRWVYDAQFLGERREHVVEIVDKKGSFFHDNQGGELSVDAFGVRDRKRYLLREPLEPGGAWSNVVSVSSVEHYKVIDAGSPCEVPAGRFQGCVRVEGRNRVDAKTTLVNELTFAPSVGLVRISTVAEVAGERIPQASFQLKSYRLPTPAADAPRG